MTRRCDDVRPDLYEFAAGKLDAGRRAAVEAHLSECADCRGVLAGASDIVSLVADWQPEPPSAGFENRVHQAILNHRMPAVAKKPRFGFGPWLTELGAWKIALPVAAAAILVVAVAVNRMGPSTPPIPETIDRDVVLPLDVAPAPTPIRVVVADVDATVSSLVEVVGQAQGTVNRRRPLENGVEVTFRAPDARLAEILEVLRKAGALTEPGSGFRDGAGRIVVLVQRPTGGARPPR